MNKIVRIMSCRVHRLFRRLLRYIFHFHMWHTSPLCGRRYAQDIIEHLNGRDASGRNSILEIGCGLGDIIRNVQYTKRVGLDSDVNVLRAARFLAIIRFNRNIEFAHFVFPVSELHSRYDVIVMVNWIHDIAPDVLRTKIVDYFYRCLQPLGEIVVDAVLGNGYRYHHSIDFLAGGLSCTVEKLGDYTYQREVYVIRKPSCDVPHAEKRELFPTRF